MSAKRRKPHTTPQPLYVVSGLPSHIELQQYGDCLILRCGNCGNSSRHGLPVVSGELQQLADEFKAAHRHERRFTDDQMEQLWRVTVLAYRALTEFGSDRTYSELPETFQELDFYLANGLDDELWPSLVSEAEQTEASE